MKQTNWRAFRHVLKSIQGTYGFMLTKGYEVVSVDDYFMGWQVVLRKQDVFARIIQSRGEEEMDFRTGTPPPDEFTDIGSVIFAATGEKIPRWESSDPKVIEQSLDKIETYLRVSMSDTMTVSEPPRKNIMQHSRKEASYCSQNPR